MGSPPPGHDDDARNTGEAFFFFVLNRVGFIIYREKQYRVALHQRPGEGTVDTVVCTTSSQALEFSRGVFT